jgi:hypothetical protein
MAMSEFRKDLRCPIKSNVMVTEGVCFEASRIKSNQLQFCLPNKCDSSFRLCPACMVQLSSDQIRKMIEKRAKREILVASNGDGFLLCKFHSIYGPDATREGRGIIQPLGDRLWSLIFGRSRKETNISFEQYNLDQPVKVVSTIQTLADIIKSQPKNPDNSFEIRKLADFSDFTGLAKAMKKIEAELNFPELCPLNFRARKIAEIFSCAPFLAEILLSEDNGWLLKYIGPKAPPKERMPIDVAHGLMLFPLEQRIKLAAQCLGKNSREGQIILKNALSWLQTKANRPARKEKITPAEIKPTAPKKTILAPVVKLDGLSFLPDGYNFLQLPYLPVSLEKLTDAEPPLETVGEIKKEPTTEKEELMGKKIVERRKNISPEEKEALKKKIETLRADGKKDRAISEELKIPANYIWRYCPKGKAAAKDKVSTLGKSAAKRQLSEPEQQGDAGAKAILEMLTLPGRVAVLEAQMKKIIAFINAQIDFTVGQTEEKQMKGLKKMEDAKDAILKLQEMRKTLAL